MPKDQKSRKWLAFADTGDTKTPPAPTDLAKKLVYGVHAFSSNAAFSDGDPEC